MWDYFIHLQVKCVTRWPLICQKCVNICTGFVFLHLDFMFFLLF